MQQHPKYTNSELQLWH